MVAVAKTPGEGNPAHRCRVQVSRTSRSAAKYTTVENGRSLSVRIEFPECERRGSR